jgi:DNA-binding NarL/FixJ family response regulator
MVTEGAAGSAGVPRRRVVVVDDHAAFADLLTLALDGLDDIDCIGTARSMSDALSLVARTDPDLVVIDLLLGHDSGLELVRRLRAERPDLLLVVASARSDTGTLTAVAAAGANGFAPKSGAFGELLAVLRASRIGAISVAPSLLPEAADPPKDAWTEKLTARESDVLTLMGRGASVPEIARTLNISLNTCRSYVRAVHSKLGVSTQLEAVLRAQQIGLIRPSDGS